MVEYTSASAAVTYRNGGVLMSVQWCSDGTEDFSSRKAVVNDTDQATLDKIARALLGASSLRKLLALRKGALKFLRASGDASLQGLGELVDEALADLLHLENEICSDYFSRVLGPTFDFARFEEIVSFLPQTGRAFLNTFRNDPNAENAETVYLWSIDLDRTISDYLSECSARFDTVSTTIAISDCSWALKRRESVLIALDLCAG